VLRGANQNVAFSHHAFRWNAFDRLRFSTNQTSLWDVHAIKTSHRDVWLVEVEK